MFAIENLRECMKTIVGFFDILGYTSFLENSETEIIARSVLKIINSIPKVVKDEASLIFPDILNKYQEINFLVFSDSILMTLELESPSITIGNYNKWSRFIICAVFLYRMLLTSGLPVRGAISHGDIVIDKNCFAGEPIVNAYKLSTNLNLSATVVADESGEFAKKLDDKMEQE